MSEMSLEEVVTQLRRGLCHPARVQAQGCHLCGPQHDAIAQVVRWHQRQETGEAFMQEMRGDAQGVASNPFKEDERGLAQLIAYKTGCAPVVATVVDPSAEHPYEVLRFWMREQDVGVTRRDMDLRGYHPRESVKLALRAAVRWVRLDHVGGHILETEAGAPCSHDPAQNVGTESTSDER